MATYMDGWASGALLPSSSSSGMDWLNNGLNSISNAAVKVFETKATIDGLNKSSNDTQQQSYQNAQQTIGSKNIVSGVDNNVLLLAVGGGLVAFMLFKG